MQYVLFSIVIRRFSSLNLIAQMLRSEIKLLRLALLSHI